MPPAFIHILDYVALINKSNIGSTNDTYKGSLKNLKELRRHVLSFIGS